MARARRAGLRRGQARAAAGGRNDSLEAGLRHPAFEPLRSWLDRLPDPLRALPEDLSRLAAEAGIRVASGKPLEFVRPGDEGTRYGEYELRVFETGRVETRPGNLHDLFNALAWLAFPRTKATLNALHVRAIPTEGGRRGRFRDLLTIVDEGGALVACDDPTLITLVKELRWKDLFWRERERLLRGMRILVVGHSVLERALAPWPAITCKALFVPVAGDPDSHAAAWLAGLPPDATPRALGPLPVFGFPGWHADAAEPTFYEDERYFRPSRARDPGRRMSAGSRPGSRYGDIEESPGSEERDAG